MNMTEKPKDKQKVFALLADGSIAEHYWSNNDTENRMFYQGNIFETEENAREESKNRQVRTIGKELGAKILRPTLQIEEDGNKNYLIIDGKYKVDFEDIMKSIEAWKRLAEQWQRA